MNKTIFLTISILFLSVKVLAQTTLSAQIPEAIEEGKTLEIPISIANPIDKSFELKINYTKISAGIDESDFNMQLQSHTVKANSVKDTIRIAILNDDIVEGNETFKIELATAAFSIDQPIKEVTILNTTVATISVQDASAEESENLIFNVVLDKDVDVEFSLDLEFEDISNPTSPKTTSPKTTSSRDFDHSKRKVYFKGKKGETHKVRIKAKNDLMFGESSEVFIAKISGLYISNHLKSKEYIPYINTNDRAQGIILKPRYCRTCPTKEFIDSLTPFKLELVGNGNLQASFTEGNDIPASTAIGVRLTEHFKNNQNQTWLGFYKLDFDAFISVASTIGNLTTESDAMGGISNSNIFGNSILTPINTGQAVDINAKLFRKEPFVDFPILNLVSGLEFNFTSSNRDWIYNLSGDTNTYQTTVNAFKVSIFHDIVKPHLRDRYNVILKWGYAYNSLRGDIGLNNNEEIAVRREILGTGHRRFSGMQTGLELRIENIRASFTYYFLMTNNKTNIPGLTGSRLVTNISFVGGFPIIDTKKAEEAKTDVSFLN